ncbi:phosphatidylinositol-glycan biosynthesis class W protein isoform X4 [Patella vulgata]|nr:phosphatidylinositol-glycan biosynthesis class W protein isoform X4 [Patella vulgata]XP_050402412.1 phosphatidylinositol-glycan biosynthesis class W protein isoform X4 [Patella vulgata]XP_050402413.1 phosphatidylinositol-glycan biosynthesis class W protein isoform X4 [Patella vulgata]XP_055956131.1 phosphatidylinositol-glycan biosynthesis class W protein isoform X4 [Patella vulgata]XP_055956132.1 phosphatidylinositol-glycan biosynthesis class W protein isoform X4 [Patella vulgata]
MGETGYLYKKLHEDFIDGHNGTTMSEVSTIAAVSVIAVLLRDSVMIALSLQTLQVRSKFFLDFVCIILPLILGPTMFSEHLFIFVTSLVCLIILSIFMSLAKKTEGRNEKYTRSGVFDIDMSEKRPFINYFRAILNVQTAVVILAVDFTIFPRRYVKTETYGTGSMDVGVGCFIIGNAIVSPEARGKYKDRRFFSDKVLIIENMIKSSIPLIVLGLLRVLFVKSADYQEHVSEYGVHWNFFLTLAAVKIISTVILCILPVTTSSILSVVITVLYQYALCRCGLSQYILNGSDGQGTRYGILDANREGLFSCIGYTALYFAGVQLGQYLFIKRTKLHEWLKFLSSLVAMCMLSLCLLWFLSNAVEPVSRRLCNAAYIVWMIVVNLQMIGGFLFGDILIKLLIYLTQGAKILAKPDIPACILSAVNYNALFYFLLANILTGLVNISMQTIYTSTFMSFLILLIYLLLLSFVSMFLYHNKILVKSW